MREKATGHIVSLLPFLLTVGLSLLACTNEPTDSNWPFDANGQSDSAAECDQGLLESVSLVKGENIQELFGDVRRSLRPCETSTESRPRRAGLDVNLGLSCRRHAYVAFVETPFRAGLQHRELACGFPRPPWPLCCAGLSSGPTSPIVAESGFSDHFDTP